jgi:hypothetical protein
MGCLCCKTQKEEIKVTVTSPVNVTITPNHKLKDGNVVDCPDCKQLEQEQEQYVLMYGYIDNFEDIILR